MNMEQLNKAVEDARRAVTNLKFRQAKILGRGEVIQRQLSANHKQLILVHHDITDAEAVLEKREADLAEAALGAVGLEAESVAVEFNAGDAVQWTTERNRSGNPFKGVYLTADVENPKFALLRDRSGVIQHVHHGDIEHA